MKLWSMQTGQLLRSLEGHRHGIVAVAFSPDKKMLFSGDWDGGLKLWRVP